MKVAPGKTKIGYIGLGNVGVPLASNLLKAGYSVLLFDIRPERIQLLVDRGGIAAKSARQLGQETEIILMSLPHPKISEEIVVGTEGILEECNPGNIVIETSTISPALARKLGDECKKKNVHFIDAALAGGIERAIPAKLVFMIGGEKSVVKDVWPIFETLGEHLFYLGGISSGMTVKVVNNAISHVTMVAISEAVSVGVKAGLDPSVVYDVLSHGSADSDILRRRYKGRVLKGNYDDGMILEHAYKDSELICDLGREMGVPIFVTNCAHAVYEWAKADGLGHLDYASIIKLWENVLGLKITGVEKKNKTKW